MKEYLLPENGLLFLEMINLKELNEMHIKLWHNLA